MTLLPLFLVTFGLCSLRRISADFQGPGDESDIPVSDAKGQTVPSDTDKERNKLRSVFPQIDTNGNGRISVQELASRTDRSMKAFYKQEADTRMKALDTNKDGKVTWEEYTTGAENRGGFTEQQREREERRFKRADVNKDGGLSRDELISMFHPEESPHMFAVIVEEFMEFVDSDRDGYLSFDEYKVRTVASANANRKNAEESFKKLDQDKDGRLNKEEMKVWLAAINTSSQAKSQAQRLVNRADENKDGVLSEEEMVNHMELFTDGNEGYQSRQTRNKEEL